MKYVSLDLETTGLDLNRSQILMISMIVEDTEAFDEHGNLPAIRDLPSFTAFVKYDHISYGEPFGLQMNSWIFKETSCRDEDRRYPSIPILSSCEAALDSKSFLVQEGFRLSNRPYAAGANVGTFDLQLLRHQWPILYRLFHYRPLEVASVLIDWGEGLQGLIDMQSSELLKPEFPATHHAWDDAAAVIELLRQRYAWRGKSTPPAPPPAQTP